MHKVALRPPGRGLPPYFPKRVSYLIMTASTKAPLLSLMRSFEVRLSEEWKTEWREEERGVLKLERRKEYADGERES